MNETRLLATFKPKPLSKTAAKRRDIKRMKSRLEFFKNKVKECREALKKLRAKK